VNLKLTTGSCDGDSGVISHNLRCDHCKSLALCRVDFSWHDTAPRLIFGEAQFAESAAGSGTKISNVVCDFHQRAGKYIECAVGFYQSVMCSQGLELKGVKINERNKSMRDIYLVRCCCELEASQFRNLCGNLDIKSFLCVQAL
jgi:hypothetical protein